jgi:hypothetical protein
MQVSSVSLLQPLSMEKGLGSCFQHKKDNGYANHGYPQDSEDQLEADNHVSQQDLNPE